MPQHAAHSLWRLEGKRRNSVGRGSRIMKRIKLPVPLNAAPHSRGVEAQRKWHPAAFCPPPLSKTRLRTFFSVPLPPACRVGGIVPSESVPGAVAIDLCEGYCPPIMRETSDRRRATFLFSLRELPEPPHLDKNQPHQNTGYHHEHQKKLFIGHLRRSSSFSRWHGK